MAATLDPKTSFGETTTIVKCVADELVMTDPSATPLLKYISPNMNNLSGVFNSDPYYWVDDTLEPVSVTLQSQLTTGQTNLQVQSGMGEYFRKGTVVKLDDELVLVATTTDASKADDTAVISHAFADTTATHHTTGATAYIVGQATLETETVWDSFYVTPTMPWNRVQIMSAPLEMTQLEMNTARHSDVNDWQYQKDKVLLQLMKRLNRNLYDGVREASTPTAAIPGAFGGLMDDTSNWPIYDSGDNVLDLGGAALTEDHIEDAMEEIFDAVGTDNMPKLLVCSGHAKRKISSWWENRVRIDRAQNEIGLTIDRIETDFGYLDVLMDMACPKAPVSIGSLFLLNTDHIKFGPHVGCEFTWYAPAITMIGKQEVLWGAYTLEIGAAKTHGRLYNFSTTA